MSRALMPVSVLSKEICKDIGDSNFKWDFSIMRHIIDGYREMHLFVDQDFDVKTEVLNYSNEINLPKDWVYTTKVGLQHPNGCIAILTLDNGVRTKKLNDNECRPYLDSVWNNSNSGAGSGYYFYNYWNGSYLGELYGQGRCVHNAGFYSENRKYGTLSIGTHVPDDCKVVIEYKSDGIVGDGLKLIPTEMKKCLEYYAKWQHCLNQKDPRASKFEELYDQQYYRVKRLYNFRSALYMSAKINSFFSPSNY